MNVVWSITQDSLNDIFCSICSHIIVIAGNFKFPVIVTAIVIFLQCSTAGGAQFECTVTTINPGA